MTASGTASVSQESHSGCFNDGQKTEGEGCAFGVFIRVAKQRSRQKHAGMWPSVLANNLSGGHAGGTLVLPGAPEEQIPGWLRGRHLPCAGWCDTYYHRRIIKPRTPLHRQLFILIFLKALAHVSVSAQRLKSLR